MGDTAIRMGASLIHLGAFAIWMAVVAIRI
jgi:hypothetical protein